MLNVTTTAPNHLHLHLEGRLDADAMKVGLDALIEQSAEVAGGRLLYTVDGDFQMPTPGALMFEMGRLPSLFALLARYDRCAVVAPQGWVRTMAEVEGHLIPGIDIKAFEPSEQAAAEAWLDG